MYSIAELYLDARLGLVGREAVVIGEKRSTSRASRLEGQVVRRDLA